MTKIGVLTYLREYSNLGTNMQAYCTLKAVEKAHPAARVELIDYSSWRPLMRPYLSSVSARSLRNDYVRIKKYRRFFDEELVFSRCSLISSDLSSSLAFIRNQGYDAIYVGSDTVLELKRAQKDELTPYWLHRSVPGAKVLIAASAHNVTFDALSGSQRQRMNAAVDDFALLGVRDEATLRLLTHFTREADERLQLVPDPTFSYDIDYRLIEQYLTRNDIAFDRPVVCLHLLRDSHWAPALAASFKAAGYRIASLRPACYADLLFTDLSPFEQMGLYRYFDLVITHRFHDAIFCLKNLTPVIAFPEHVSDVTSYGESKIHSLLRPFGIHRSNCVEDKDRITAEYLFGVHRDAIAAFRERREEIASVLQGHKAKYEAFVTAASVLVQKRSAAPSERVVASSAPSPLRHAQSTVRR